MKLQIIVTCIASLFSSGCTTPAINPQQEHAKDTSYTIENCISEFSTEDVIKTEQGWKYWHVSKDLSPTFNFKISNVGPQSANHADHTHEEEEIFYILEGTAEFSFDGKTRIVGPKSAMFCPSGISHGIRNAGDKPLTYAVIKANYHTGN